MADPVTIGIEVALMAASMALTASQKIQGPRLDTLDVTLSEYGTPLPRFWGIRRFEVPIIWAEKLREKKKKSKTKGGKYAEYKYYGTWAIAVADHQIDSVSRIWLDKHLAYDVTGTGPVSIGALFGDKDSVKLANGTNMRVYLGDQTEPDPRIESWCEDRYGANTAPAYRDVAYIVFQDIPLEKFGNRIPQISVEAIHTKTDIYPSESIPGHGSRLSRMGFTPGFDRMVTTTSLATYVWDIPSRTEILVGPATPVGATFPAMRSDGGYYVAGGFPSTLLYECTADGGAALLSSAADFYMDGCAYVGGLICPYPYAGTGNCLLYSAGNRVAAASLTTSVTCYFESSEGEAWGVNGGTNSFGLFRVPDADETRITTTTSGDAYAMDNGAGSFVVWQGSTLYLVDKAARTITATATGATFTGGTEPLITFSATAPGSPYLWISNKQFATSDLTLVRAISTGLWAGSNVLGGTYYDPVNNALITQGSAGNNDVTWRYLDRVGSNGVTLQTVVDDVSTWCGLSGQDTAALTQTVQGYSVTQGSGKDMIAPLLDIHDVDPRPHDFTVQFVVRGGAAAGTITTSELAREGDEARYIANITQDTDLPRKVTFSFADKGHDQQANNVIAQRPLDSVDAQREQSIDLGTYVSDPATAQQFADRYLRRQWIGRQRFTLGLTAQRLALEPADVYSLQLDDITVKARLTKVTLTNGKLQTEWERDGASVHTVGTGTGGSMDGRDPEVIYIPGPTKGFVKDIPLLSDVDSSSNPLLYYAAGPYSSMQNWPGAYLMQGDADGVDFDIEWNAVDSSHGTAWGYATDALPDANPSVWDRGSTVNVAGYLTLSSVTEAEIDADATLNMALLGDELINFTTATLESDGSYTLSGFKRGRRGTEWATATHAIGDEFVLASGFASEALGLSEVGVDEHYKVQTAGRPIDQAPPIDVAFTGRSLIPYAPARLKTYFDGTDLQCTIFRRTRVGGSWTGGSSIALSEASESYEIDVYSGLTLKRTITSSTTTFTYTAAMAATDGITLPTQPTFHVYQMSDAVGRGFALAA